MMLFSTTHIGQNCLEWRLCSVIEKKGDVYALQYISWNVHISLDSGMTILNFAFHSDIRLDPRQDKLLTLASRGNVFIIALT